MDVKGCTGRTKKDVTVLEAAHSHVLMIDSSNFQALSLTLSDFVT